MMVPIGKLFLRNRGLETKPEGQRKSGLYQKIKDCIKKDGYIINPLLCIKEGDFYKVCVGNNRYLAAIELGYRELPIKVLENEDVATLKSELTKYKRTGVQDA